MSDLTRDEAVQWCKDKEADFITPVFPPPEGWMWADAEDGLTLEPIFTVTDQGEGITKAEVYSDE